MYIRSLSISVLLLFTSLGCSHSPLDKNPALIAQEEVHCFGPESAIASAVYLHGIDSISPSARELENRRKLNAIATTLNIRIALPRATYRCNGDSLCWGWETNPDETQKAINIINEAVQACSPAAKEIGLIGFSSGGYMIMKIFRSNLFHTIKPPASWSVVIGSGLMKGPLEYEPKRVEGHLTLIVGKQDKYNFDPKQNYYNQLKKKNDQVEIIEFNGGHELPFAETLSAIRNRVYLK